MEAALFVPKPQKRSGIPPMPVLGRCHVCHEADTPINPRSQRCYLCSRAYFHAWLASVCPGCGERKDKRAESCVACYENRRHLSRDRIGRFARSTWEGLMPLKTYIIHHLAGSGRTLSKPETLNAESAGEAVKMLCRVQRVSGEFMVFDHDLNRERVTWFPDDELARASGESSVRDSVRVSGNPDSLGS